MIVVFLNLLTERTRIDQHAFLAGSYAFFRPYHLTRTALIRDFPTKLREGTYGSCDNFTYYRIQTTDSKEKKHLKHQRSFKQPHFCVSFSDLNFLSQYFLLIARHLQTKHRLFKRWIALSSG